MIQKNTQKIVILATGGTIAGVAQDPTAPENYQSGQLAVVDLMHTIDTEAHEVVTEQVSQIDSKDMDEGLWRKLAQRCAYWLAQDCVQGLVVTHGTDTLEETAFFLNAVLPDDKPVVLTCAMRAANAPDSDGVQNLQSAFDLVANASATGVLVVCAGEVHAAHEIQKTHSQRLNPFTSGEAGPIGLMRDGVFERLREPSKLNCLERVPSLSTVLACEPWPHVELVMSHASTNGGLVLAMLANKPPDGWVVAGTGNGTLHRSLQHALENAQALGAVVMRTSRCAQGGVQSRSDDVFQHAGLMTAVQARVRLMLELIYQRKGR
ncbi:asparaginase [Limnohabitans sp.]|uniref:asparaginase n=1 Tax=Limnohabitans sp. TaxID=1907725 RepID=UPI0038BAB5D3